MSDVDVLPPRSKAAEAPAPKTIVFLADAGAGHRTTAKSLLHYMPDEARERVTLVNPYAEILAKAGPIDRVMATFGEKLYNLLLMKVRGAGPIWYRLGHLFVHIIKRKEKKIDRLVGDYLEAERPDLVIVVIPLLAAHIVRQARRLSLRSLVIMSDMEEIVPDTWIPARADNFAAFSETAVSRAKSLGAWRTWLLSGPVIRPGFFTRNQGLSEGLARRLKLDRGRCCVLVFFGGYASPKMVSLARALARVQAPIEVIFVCGHSESVRSDLERLQTPYPKRTFGFIRRIDHLMDLAQVMIGKPGPGAAFEAVAKGLPVLLELDGTTLPQERANAEYVVRRGFGATFSNDEELLDGLNAIANDRKTIPDRARPPFRSDLETRKLLEQIYAEIADGRAEDSGSSSTAEQAGHV